MEFEDILKDVGDWGPFQKLFLFFGVSVALMAPFPGMALMFMVMTPNHQCYIPSDITNASVVQNSSCHMLTFAIDSENITKETSCIYGYRYDKTDFESTASTKWNMVCDNDYLPSLILTLHNIGSLVGTAVFGSLADRFGRKVLCFSMFLLSAVTDLSSAFVENYLVFVILRTISGTVLPTAFLTPYILISEFMVPKKRFLASAVFHTCWMTGMCLLALVAYMIGNWVYLSIFSGLFSALMLPYWKFVPESASWLISRGRYEDATEVMMRIGKKNKKFPAKTHLALKLKELGENNKKNKGANTSFFSFIVKYPRLSKHFLILTFCWICNNVAYLGFQYNVINVHGNVFLNFFFFSLAEAPGILLFLNLMEKLGRRWTAVIGFLGIGLTSLLTLTGFEHSALASSIIGKLLSAGIYVVTDQQGCEIIPTSMRSMGIAAGKSIASAVTLFTPFMAYLAMYGKSIPFLIISVTCLMAAVLTSFLPETLNENLPQTFLDAEDFGKDHRYFSFNWKSKPIHKVEVMLPEEKDEENCERVPV